MSDFFFKKGDLVIPSSHSGWFWTVLDGMELLNASVSKCIIIPTAVESVAGEHGVVVDCHLLFSGQAEGMMKYCSVFVNGQIHLVLECDLWPVGEE
jgi:hypothetical protein